MKYIDAEKLIEGIKHIQSKFPVITYEALFHLITSLQQEQPEVDIEKEIEEHAENMPHGEFTHDSECVEHEEWAKREFRHFYELGQCNARKEG